MTKTQIKYKPSLFFSILYLITWTSWFIASYLSYNSANPDLYTIALLPGLFAPSVIAIIFLSLPGNKAIRKDFLRRLLNFKEINILSFISICIVMCTSVIFAILISLLFGESIKQLAFSEEFSFSAGSASIVLVLIMAPLLEEIGWRGYGVDSLLSKFTVLKASLIFGVIWSFWHLPLLIVKDYNPNVLLNENIWYAINFYISIIPLGIIMNWLYIKSNRNFFVLFMFHFFLNILQVATKMTEFTGCIQTIIIILYAVIIVCMNKKMFLNKYTFSNEL